MLALAEKQMLIQALGQVVCDEVRDSLDAAVEPILRRVAQIEKLVGDLPVPRDGNDGKDGVDGKDVDPEVLLRMESLIEQNSTLLGDLPELIKNWTREFVTSALADLPKPERGEKGDPGERGEKGDKGDAGVNGVDGMHGERGEKGDKGDKGDQGERGERGENGRDGVDGVDGKSVSLDEVREHLADLVRRAVGDIPRHRDCTGGYIDRNGSLFLRFSDGSNSDLGPVVGRDGKDCDLELVRAQVAAFLDTIEKPKDGVDGVGFDDLQLDFDGERLVTLKFIKGEIAKVFNLLFPIPLYRDIWKPDVEYQRGDQTVRDGSMWIAIKDTSTVPGAPDSDWRLCTKRGRDGKQGPPGTPGANGVDGRPGRDLTQIGPNGSKW